MIGTLRPSDQSPRRAVTPSSTSGAPSHWSDDVAADVTALERHGHVTEATRKGPEGALGPH
ncbi:hypothetical protein ABZ464_09445 [Streptomyces sp. NPDC005820]|uniref:hypothetical protein n=1 Tax=Streptomyces sp. NPDC005820 TaxID=3157069 RepID=UPI0033CCF270